MFAYYKKIAGILAFTVFAPGFGHAAELQDLKFAELPGERVELRLRFDQAPSEPNGYTIEKPARIVLDFPDAENALSQKKFPINVGDVSGAVVVSGGGRTRLIVNMDNLAAYNTREEGSVYVLEVGSAGSEVAAISATTGNTTSSTNVAPSSGAQISSAPTSAAPNRFDSSRSSIREIDFRRGTAGEGRVIVKLTNPNIGIDIEEVASGIEVSFMQTSLPSELNRKLDVTDFATPVSMISTGTDPLRTVITVKASGEYDYLAYQADNEYVVSVKPLTRQELEEKRSQFAYTGEKLSLNFQDIEVRNVLQIIADVTGLNLVASDTVQGSITLRLDNVPWDQALDLILKTKGLDKRQVGNVLMVAPAAEIAERERQELETKKQLEELAPLRTEYIRIRYANAAELFELFIPQQGNGGGGLNGSVGTASGSTNNGGRGGREQESNGILSERGRAIVDERTNSIILTDTEEKIAEFKKVIEQVDIPIRQVMIEARIVIANNNFRKELGAALGSYSAFGSDNNNTLNVISNDILNSDTLELNDAPGVPIAERGGTITSAPLFDFGVTGQSAANIAWNIISDNQWLGLELSALEDSGFAEIVSQPKVITGDKQQASIESGTEIPFRDATAVGGGGGGGGVAATVSFKEALLKLDVTPQITPDDKIIMDLIINQDSIGEDTAAGPTIDITKLETQVLVPDGETVVLGGIFQSTLVTSQSKVPLLGDIPVLGRLFRKDEKEDTKRELLIFITPRIMTSSVTN